MRAGVNVELKYLDKALVRGNLPVNSAIADQAIWTTDQGNQLAGTGDLGDNNGFIIQSLVNATQSQTATGRIGRKYTIKSIKVNLGLTFVLKQDHCTIGLYRVLLVHDKQCNGGVVKVHDVLDQPNADGNVIPGSPGMNYRIGAQPNISNSQRFTILYDKTKSFNNQGMGGNTQGPYHYPMVDVMVKIYKKLNLPIEMSTTDSQISGIRSNNVFLIVMAHAAERPNDADVPLQAEDSAIGFVPWGSSRARFTDA